MTPAFSVFVSPHCERLIKKLQPQHADFLATFQTAVAILQADPHNVSRKHPIKKLRDVAAGAGQYRLRHRRWRFRYDIHQQRIELVFCGLRDENTYK